MNLEFRPESEEMSQSRRFSALIDAFLREVVVEFSQHGSKGVVYSLAVHWLLNVPTL